MIARAFKLRFRRRMRLRRRQVEEFGQQAEQQLERNFFKRLERLVGVRRFVATWMLLLLLLGGCVAAQTRGLTAYYQSPQAVPGGTYSEGVMGAFTNANPIYATGPVDVTVSKLLFGSLFTHNADNALVGDLAKDYVVDDRGTTYTVTLKKGLTWHDGKPLTAADVAFTYELIQNPDAQSPLNGSWKDITVTAVGDDVVTFTLPNQLASFPYSMTNGIVPKHVLAKESVRSLRTLTFNTSHPIGAGPFTMNALEVTGGSADTREEHIALAPFDKYHAGKPKLDRFVVHAYRSHDRLVGAFRNHEINAISGLTKVPDELKDSDATIYNIPLTAAVMVFFKVSEGPLSDVQVRQALVRGADTESVIQKLDYPTMPVRQPLLRNQLGYSAQYEQARFNAAEAGQLLDASGWVLGRDGKRTKAGEQLAFSLTVQENTDYADVAQQLKRQWLAVGASVTVETLSSSDFQTALSGHNYDAVLHGTSIGIDPDVYVYWDSSRADSRLNNRLNFSEYKSEKADAALQSGRTRSDPALRAVKYQPFLQAWQADAPALGLYQPRYLYITRPAVAGLSERTINADVERLGNVHNWMIRTAGVSQQPPVKE
jgi:peptide/nickel transport system substrate-binding protein